MCYKPTWLLLIGLCLTGIVFCGDWEDKLLKAVLEDDTERMEEILPFGPKLNDRYPDGDTVILAAIRSNNLAALEMLFNAGIHLRFHTYKELSAASYAASLGRWQVLQAFVDMGAVATLFDITGEDELTTVHLAAMGEGDDYAKTLEVLIENDVPWWRETQKGKTPMDLTKDAKVRTVLQQAEARRHDEL
eukprot:TRINITY_DN69304_c0_g1_i1.p1 TRINITY_DN69304_c0_g1~~TRINITY_DN69304_c0_g1_i1.p1  ORF type:complete len:190 (+),score=25.76 TRINITY_DN69304_c0_g1_i1:60-629(+)